MTHTPPLLLTAACALALSVSSARAGRPLATDDAATAEAGRCQLEAWAAQQPGSGELVLAPACGLRDGLELDLTLARPHPRDTVQAGAELALKGVPAAWRLGTPFGEAAFGLKLAHGGERQVGRGWQALGYTLLGLATLQPADGWALHANLGPQYDRASRQRATLLNLAATWTPSPRWMLFAETLANDRRDSFGPTQRHAGLRWWWLPERLGLDLTAGREAGQPGTRWTLGFGAYGFQP